MTQFSDLALIIIMKLRALIDHINGMVDMIIFKYYDQVAVKVELRPKWLSK